jgi:hypothetical protein
MFACYHRVKSCQGNDEAVPNAEIEREKPDAGEKQVAIAATEHGEIADCPPEYSVIPFSRRMQCDLHVR